MTKFSTKIQKNANLFDNINIQELIKHVFSTTEGKKLLKKLKATLQSPIFPASPQIIAQYGDSKTWAAFRSGQNSLIYLFLNYCEDKND